MSSAQVDFEAVMRESADHFMRLVAILAHEREQNPYELALQALLDATSRLTERGELGSSGESVE